MVILGGLEIAAAGYLIHEHKKNKRERKRLEEEASQKQRRPRRRYSDSHTQGRPSEGGHKYGYSSQSPPGGRRPSAAVSGLYPHGASSQPPPPPYYSSTLAIPQGPTRPSSTPPKQEKTSAEASHGSQPVPYIPGQYATAGHHAYQQHQPSPQSFTPHFPPQQSSTPYFPPPPTGPNAAFASQPSNAEYRPAPTQHSSDSHVYGAYGYGQQSHNRSDSSLPLGIYEPSDPAAVEGPFELSAEGPWMGDAHRTAHQTPHVRIRLPNNHIVEPGQSSAVSPPPAYRPW